MAQRSMNPRPQKEEKRRFSTHYKKHSLAVTSSLSPRSHRSSLSPRPLMDLRSRISRIQHSPPEPTPPMMPITISTARRRWLIEKRLDGYIRVVEAPAHPEVLDIAQKLNIDIVTNATIWKKLGLSSFGEKHFDIPLAEELHKYFCKYSTSARAFRTKNIPDPFF